MILMMRPMSRRTRMLEHRKTINEHHLPGHARIILNVLSSGFLRRKSARLGCCMRMCIRMSTFFPKSCFCHGIHESLEPNQIVGGMQAYRPLDLQVRHMPCTAYTWAEGLQRAPPCVCGGDRLYSVSKLRCSFVLDFA